jgi:hypothetical protein
MQPPGVSDDEAPGGRIKETAARVGNRNNDPLKPGASLAKARRNIDLSLFNDPLLELKGRIAASSRVAISPQGDEPLRL